MSGVGRLALRAATVPLLLLVVLAVTATLGFRETFDSWAFLVPAGAGAVAAAAAAAVAVWRQLLVGEAIALSLGALVLVGLAVVGGPTPSSVELFLEGIVGGWSEVLTSFTPTELTPQLRVLPLTLAWAGVLLGGELLRGTRVPALPAVGPLLALGASSLFIVFDRSIALGQGVAIAVGTLVLGLVQQHHNRDVDEDLTAGTTNRWRLGGLALAATLVLVIGAVAPMLGPRLPLADARERFDLRSMLEPPWDPLSVPSPLVGLKALLKDDRADDVVFRVSGPPVGRWPVAVLGAYDGVVWAVADQTGEAGGEFRSVDRTMPAPPDGAVAEEASEMTHTVEIVDLGAHWLPRPGYPTSIEAPSGASDVRFSQATGTAALPTGVPDGLTYEVTSLVTPQPSPQQLDQVGLQLDPAATDLRALPPAVRDLAADVVQGAGSGWPQVDAIQETFTTGGYYDKSPAARPGHSYYRLDEFLGDPERIVGFEEQYAAAAGVIARSAGLPTRVTVGYVIPEERFDDGTADVRAGDVSAWIEVATIEHGWVPVDVTPDRSREPNPEEQDSIEQDVVVPNPPPPPAPPPVQEALDEEEDEELAEAESDDDASAGDRTALLVGVAIGAPLLLAAAFAALVAGAKARRRQRRRNASAAAHRVTGAWLEVEDRFAESSIHRPATATSLEAAGLFAGGEPELHASLRRLAVTVDRSSFHPQPPADEDAQRAWMLYDETAAWLHQHRSRGARLRTLLDPRPLTRRDPVGAAKEGH